VYLRTYNPGVEEALAAALKSFARSELGFDLVGITDASPVAGATRLTEWLAAGMHGEMAWMEGTEAVRADPARFLPGARSVICVAMSCNDADECGDAPGDRAGAVSIARYARRKDYHRVVRPRLVRLGRFLAARRPGNRWRAAVDTAPVLERELAQRAGLGWIGKNTCLINRRLGSHLLLGELFTTVALPPDRPARHHCGTCTACLSACPTGAFPAAGVLDARRCIAYLTIEHHSELPAQHRAALGEHLFGCDICQSVCPWNRKAEVRCHPALRGRPHLTRPALSALQSLDEPGFLAFAAGTPLRRLGYRRFRRNLGALASDGGEP